MVGPTGEIHPKSEYVLGVEEFFFISQVTSCFIQLLFRTDFAHMGADSTVFIIVEKPFVNEDNLYVIYLEETRKMLMTDAMARIKLFNLGLIFASK